MARISLFYKLVVIGVAGFTMTACSSKSHMNTSHNQGHSQTQSSAYGAWGEHPPASRYGTISAASHCVVAVQCVPMAPIYPAQTITNNYNYPAPATVYTQPEPAPYIPDYVEPPVYVPPPAPIIPPYSYPTPVTPEPTTWKPVKK